MTTTNMEEVPLSPSKLNSNLKSPSLRVRSPSAKSNIAISRGDDDSSIDDDRINNKMCVSDGSTITCVFNKKRLFGGSAFALVAVVVIMAVAIATRSDGGSSSSANHMNKVASVGGGNSNAAVGTANVESAAPPPKVAPVPKVTPVAPAKSNFAFVAPQAGGVGGGSAVERCPGVSGSGKSGKSGSFCYSSGKSGKSGGHGNFINIDGSSWYGSGKSGKSGSYFPAQTCAKPSGKSGKSGYNSFLDAYRPTSYSGKSGKSGAGYCTLSPENKANECVNSDAQDINAGCWQGDLTAVEKIKLDDPICASLSSYAQTVDEDVYRFDVICPGLHTLILRNTGVDQVTTLGAGFIGGVAGSFFPYIQPRVFGSNSQCQAFSQGSGGTLYTPPFTDELTFGENFITSQFFDLKNGIYAVTVDVTTCGPVFLSLQPTANAEGSLTQVFRGCSPEDGVNCGELGGFLYSVELTEGVVPCKTILADGTVVNNCGL